MAGFGREGKRSSYLPYLPSRLDRSRGGQLQGANLVDDPLFEIPALFALMVVFVVIALGWPISGYVMGLGAAFGLLKFCAVLARPNDREPLRDAAGNATGRQGQHN